MAQKANLVSLRRSNFLKAEPNINPKIFILTHHFLNILDQVFNLKNILILQKFIAFNGNEIFINASIFVKTIKIEKITKSLKLKKKNYKKQLTSNFFNLIKQSFTMYSISSLKLKLKIINFYVDIGMAKFCLFSLKNFLRLLFSRRLKLYVDFSQILVLYYNNYLNNKVLLYNLAIIFCKLKKNKHSKFLTFVNDIINLLITILPKHLKTKQSTSKINGIKFVLNGKIGGKTRSASQTILIGNVPNQTIDKNIDFAKISVTTIYGVYGMKMWTYRTN